MSKEKRRCISVDDLFLDIKPYPNVEISTCKSCNRLTENWITKWPESKIILWLCKDCEQHESKYNFLKHFYFSSE